jgi:hypothetical protein
MEINKTRKDRAALLARLCGKSIEESEVGLACHRSVTIASSKTGFWLEEFAAPTLFLGTPVYS